MVHFASKDLLFIVIATLFSLCIQVLNENIVSTFDILLIEVLMTNSVFIVIYHKFFLKYLLIILKILAKVFIILPITILLVSIAIIVYITVNIGTSMRNAYWRLAHCIVIKFEQIYMYIFKDSFSAKISILSYYINKGTSYYYLRVLALKVLNLYWRLSIYHSN